MAKRKEKVYVNHHIYCEQSDYYKPHDQKLREHIERLNQMLPLVSDPAVAEMGFKSIARFRRLLEGGFRQHICSPVVGHVLHDDWTLYIGKKSTPYNLTRSKWANPYSIKEYGREESFRLYQEYLLNSPALLDSIGEIQGHTLACWCKTPAEPNALCHGDALVALYDEWAERMWRKWGFAEFQNGSELFNIR